MQPVEKILLTMLDRVTNCAIKLIVRNLKCKELNTEP